RCEWLADRHALRSFPTRRSSDLTSLDFSDPCFVQAGEHLQELIATEPFNTGFLATPAQTGPTSASGLLATGKVAMELAGHWEPRSEEHTSELQSRENLVCRLLLE